MRLLLDTHSFLWFVGGDPRLGEKARALIEDETNQLFLSVASLWEMAIKISLGKLSLGQPFEVLVPQQLQENAIILLDITIDHTALVAKLPFHHRDPFDRLLVAQAMVERLSIISGDPLFEAYAVSRIW